MAFPLVDTARAQSERFPGDGGGGPVRPTPGCSSDLDCDLTQVCRSVAKLERALLRPGPSAVCVRDTVDPTAALLGTPLYVGPRSDRFTDQAVWVTGELSDNRWIAEAWFELDGMPLETKFLSGDELASADVSSVRLQPDGPHALVLWVRDGAGNLGSATGLVTMDSRAPKVTLVAEIPSGASTAVVPADGLVFDTTSLRAGVRIEELNPAAGHFTASNLSFPVTHPGSLLPKTTLEPLYLPEGAHLLSAVVTDLAGNTGIAAATIWVDKTPPVVTSRVVDNVIAHCAPENLGPYHWIIDVADLTATTIEVLSAGSRLGRFGTTAREIITDLEPGENVVTVAVTDAAGHVSIFEQILILDVTPLDDGNGCTTDTCDPVTGLVSHVDEEPPTLSFSGVDGGQLLSEVGPCGAEAVVTWGASADDCSDGDVAVTCSPTSGSVFPLGTTVVTCSATDQAGNTATGSFQVVVYDGPGAWELMPLREQTWEESGHALGGAGAQAVKAIAIAPTDPDRMAIGIDTARVLVSDNGGRDWIPRSDGIDAVGVFSLAFDPDHDDVLWAAAMNSKGDDPDGDGLYRSTDFGQSWHRVLTAHFPKFRSAGQSGEPPSSQTRWIAFGPAAAGQSRVVYLASREQGLLTGTEGEDEDSWDWVNDGPDPSSGCALAWDYPDLESPVELNVVLRDPDPAGYLWIAGVRMGEVAGEQPVAGLCRRAPGGQWENVPLPAGAAEVRDFVLDPGPPGRLLVALGAMGVFERAASGEQWEQLQGLPSKPNGTPHDWAMLAIGAAPLRILYAEPDRTSAPVHYSPDGGGAWSPGQWPSSFFGGPGTKAKAIAAHPVESHVAFNNNPVRVTRDGGVTWQLSNNGFDGARRGSGRSAVAFDPADADRMMFFHIDHGATLTEDGGQTWSVRHAPRQPDLNTQTQDGGVWNPVTGRVVASIGYYDDTRLCLSDDDGSTWSTDPTGLCLRPEGIAYPSGTKTTFGYFAMHPDHRNIVYVQRTRKTAGSEVHDILRSENADAQNIDGIVVSFQPVGPEGLVLQAMDPTNGDVLYAHKRIPREPDANHDEVWFQTEVWRSTDRGESWSAVGNVFNCGQGREIDVDGSSIYVGCGGGVWVYDGTTWSRRATHTASGVSTADSHGRRDFGYVAVDRRHPGVVYAAQRSLGGGHGAGIFRSLDHGETWTNINANLGTSINIWGIAVSPRDSSVLIATDLGSYRLRPDDLETATPAPLRAVIDDGNACTIDACDPYTGEVTHLDTTPEGTCCAPADGALTVIDDGNPCTTDTCSPDGSVTHVDTEAAIGCCDPTTGERAPIDDGVPCTADVCDPLTGEVTHVDPPADACCELATGLVSPRDDGDACTTDSCHPKSGAAVHVPVDVADDSACTVDLCDPMTGEITHVDATSVGACCSPSDGVLTAIDDHDACTTDVCDAATGRVDHTPKDIDDRDACTVDACDPATGAVTHEPAPLFIPDAETVFYLEPAATDGFPAEDLEFNARYLEQALGVEVVMDLPAASATNVIVMHRPDRESPPDPYEVDTEPDFVDLPFEGFRADVGAARLDLYAGDPRGQRYGLQWLIDAVAGESLEWQPVCAQTFEDAPALRLRAFHPGNYSVEELMAALDDVSAARINVIQWHLRPLVRLDALGLAQGGRCPPDVEGVVEGAWPEPFADEDVDALLQAAAERHIMVVPSVKLLTHQEKLFASDELAADRPCPDRDAVPPLPAVTVLDRVEQEWPGLLLPRLCPPHRPDCDSRVYDPTYIFPPGATVGARDVGGLDIYEGVVFPLLDELVDRFGAIRPVSAVVIGHDETVDGALSALATRLAEDGAPDNDRTPAQIFAGSVLVLHDYLAERGLWSIMWGDMLIPGHDDPAGQLGLEVSLDDDEAACLAPPVYMEDAVHGDRDAIGADGGAFDILLAAFCRHPSQTEDCAMPVPPHLRIGDWHYFHPYADYPSNDYLSALAPVYGASWHRNEYITNFTRDVVAAGGPGMIATSWGLPAAYPPPMANMQHIIAFSGATYWTGGDPTPGHFGWEPRPNDMPGDSRILMTRVACGDDDDPGVVSELLAPGDCGHVWVSTRDIAAGPDDLIDPATLQGWEVEAINGRTAFFAIAPQYVPTGAPGAPWYTWRLDLTVPDDARAGPYRVKVRYADAGWLSNLTVHEAAFTVGTPVGDELVVNGGFQVDDDGWDIGDRNHIQESLSCDGGATSCAAGDGERALCLAVETSCPACTWTECGGGESCGCTYSHTVQRVTLPEGTNRRFVLTYRLRTEGRHEAGPDEAWNDTTVQVDAYDDSDPECWPDKLSAGNVCHKRWVTGSVTTTDGWRRIEVVLAPSDETTHLEVRPYVANKGAPSTGVSCFDDFSLREILRGPNLLFTQYVEGADHCGAGESPCNKALEITNHGAFDVALSTCDVAVQVVAGAAPQIRRRIPLTGVLAPGDSHVLCHTRAGFAAECDQTATTLTFDGDDAILLRCDGVVLDAFGQLDAAGLTVPPVGTWGTGMLTTAGRDLRRACTATRGGADALDPFDPADGWWTDESLDPDAPLDLGVFGIDDGNACTSDTCDALSGLISHTDTTPDGQCCAPADGTRTLIDDGNSCTSDTCDTTTGAVTNTPDFQVGVECCDPWTGTTGTIDDGNACTSDTCDALTGLVSHAETTPDGQCCAPADGMWTLIDDGNACTSDTCDALSGLVSHTDVTPDGQCCDPTNAALAPIDDLNACTGDTCDHETGTVTHTDWTPLGVCCGPADGAQIDIDDGNACTFDTCDPETGSVTHADPTPQGCCPQDDGTGTNTHWRRNTFPGPGHRATVGGGPWERGEGTDRAEYITSFGVSPVGPNFMLMGADVAGLTVARDGRNFVSANLPVNSVSHIAFDPIDAGTAYVWARDAGHHPTLSGWWQTTDFGRSWRLMLSEADGAIGIEDIGGALNPFHVRPLAVAAAPDGGPPHIYVGTVGNGLLRSTDGGETFFELAPEPYAFSNKTIRTLALSADGTALYALVAERPDAETTSYFEFSGELWVYSTQTDSWTYPQPGHRFEDVEVSPFDPSAGFLVRTLQDNGLPTGLHRFASYGASRGPKIDTLASATVPDNAERGDVQTVRINPSNAAHIVVTRRGTRLPWLMQWSTDGGETWDTWPIPEDGIMLDFTDYAPLNHDLVPSYGYRLQHLGEVFDPSDGDYLESPGVERGRWPDLVAFLPHDPESVAIWGPTSGLKAPLLSRDFGRTFEPFAHGGTFKRTNQVAVSNGDRALAVARTEYGVVASDDGGAVWRGSGHINQLTDAPTFWPDGALPRDYRSRTAWGVGVSPDGTRVVAVVGDQVDDWGEETYDPPRPAVVMLSADSGRTWTRQAMAVKKTQVFWHRQRPEVVYAGGMVSEDAGTTWRELSGGREVVAMSEADGDMIVFLRGQPTDAVPQMKLFLSHLGPDSGPGSTLTAIDDAPVDAFEDAFLQQSRFIAVDPRAEWDPRTNGGRWRLLMAGTEGVYTYVTDDLSGASALGWVATGSDSGFVSIDKHPDDDRDIVVFLNKIVFDPRPGFQDRVYAAGGGYTLETVTSTPRTRALWYPYLRGSAPYRQLYQSDDGGVTWSRMHGDCVTGLPDYLDVQALAVSADTGRLFVHAWSGLYVLDVDGVDESSETFRRGWTATPE